MDKPKDDDEDEDDDDDDDEEEDDEEEVKKNEDEDDDEDEEEIIVYANFEEGTLDKEIFQKPDLKFKVIGLESDTPVVQLGDTTYKGVWNDTIGTRVFFEEDPSPNEPVDPVFTVVPPKMLKYKCMSTKTLDLSRIFLKPKNSECSTGSDVIEKVHDELEKEMDGNEEVLEMVRNTIAPDTNTSELMQSIVQCSAMDVLEGSNEPDETL